MPQNVHGTDGSIIFCNDSFCDGNETAVYQHELTSQVASFTYLYDAFHSDILYQPEIQVINPHPSQPKGKYLYPRDFFLTADGAKLMKMEKDEFIHYGKVLIKKRGVTNFMLVGGLFGQDMIRLAIAFDFDGTEPEGNCTVYVSETVSGGTAGKNKQGMELFRSAMKKTMSSQT